MNTETTSDPKKYGKFHALNVFLGDKISHFFPHLSLTHICEHYSVGVGVGGCSMRKVLWVRFGGRAGKDILCRIHKDSQTNKIHTQFTQVIITGQDRHKRFAASKTT